MGALCSPVEAGTGPWDYNQAALLPRHCPSALLLSVRFVPHIGRVKPAAPVSHATLPATHWSLVLAACGTGPTTALEKLCEDYRPSLYAFLRFDAVSVRANMNSGQGSVSWA